MPQVAKHNALEKVCGIIVVVGMLNFFAFAAGAFYIGGDAINGKAEGGHYYVRGVRTEAGQKVYTEVSKSVFTYSKWHAYSLFATWPFVMLAGFAVNRAGTLRMPFNRNPWNHRWGPQ